MRRSRKAERTAKTVRAKRVFCRSIERNNFRRFTLGCPFGSFGQAKEQVQNFKPARLGTFARSKIHEKIYVNAKEL